MRRLNKDEINSNIETILDLAFEAMIDSYCPYSNFRVGAAIFTSKGNIYTGSNIENMAYGSTICAERSAVCHANAHGERGYLYVAIITKNGSSPTFEPTAPCGACRQMLYEFAQLCKIDTQIVMSDTRKTKVVVASINELLPFGFGSAGFSKI